MKAFLALLWVFTFAASIVPLSEGAEILIFKEAQVDPKATAVVPNDLPAEVVAALKTGTKFVLFSLEPPVTSVEEPHLKPGMSKDQEVKELQRAIKELKLNPSEGHHGYTILGSTELADAAAQASAIAAITDAVRGFDGTLAACFEPRHSLRVIAANGTRYDLVACFECRQVYVYRGDTRIGTAGMTGSQKRLDDLLVTAKIPLAKPAPAK